MSESISDEVILRVLKRNTYKMGFFKAIVKTVRDFMGGNVPDIPKETERLPVNLNDAKEENRPPFAISHTHLNRFELPDSPKKPLERIVADIMLPGTTQNMVPFEEIVITAPARIDKKIKKVRVTIVGDDAQIKPEEEIPDDRGGLTELPGRNFHPITGFKS